MSRIDLVYEEIEEQFADKKFLKEMVKRIEIKGGEGITVPIPAKDSTLLMGAFFNNFINDTERIYFVLYTNLYCKERKIEKAYELLNKINSKTMNFIFTIADDNEFRLTFCFADANNKNLAECVNEIYLGAGNELEDYYDALKKLCK